ncbi:MAG: protein FxsA [Frankiales bacterium]|jgi:UPF0716 protein FxsA|nr:protein FxsA [Frankiales bacterium]
MPLVLLLLFVVVPIVEIYVIVQVGSAIGVLPTIVLLIADAVIGTWLVRREGRKAWRALQQAITEHRVPTREVTDGALVVVGGALMLAPGFVTDAVGLLCVLPPSRAVLRRLVSSWVARRLLGGGGVVPKDRSRRRRGDVIEGEVLDEQPPE